MRHTTIIIPVKGVGQMTRVCIDSVKRHLQADKYRVLVIDNLGDFSHNGVQAIRGDDWGFAHSCNVGAAEFPEDDVLFLNNDTEATGDFLTPMKRLLGKPVGVVGCLLLYPNGTIQHAGSRYNGGMPDHPGKGLVLHEYPKALNSRTVEGVTGACMLVDRECWNELGGFDEQEFPFGYEDIDLCKRAWKAGWKVYYTPEARVIHKEHITQRKYLGQTKRKSNVSIRNLRKRWGK